MGKLKRLAAIAAIPATLTLAPIVTSATAPAATITIRPEAVLQPGYVPTVLVTVDYSCSPSTETPALSVEVFQSGGAVGGVGSAIPVCDDTKHTATIPVSGVGFTPGPAAAFAQLLVLGLPPFVSTNAEITIK